MRKPLRLMAACAALLLSFAHARAQEKGAPKVEVGPLFSSLSVNVPNDFGGGDVGTQTQTGFGVRATYNLTDYFAADADFIFYPKKSFHTFTTGGRVAQGQFGVKVGKRAEKFGVFAKARPGFVSFGEASVVTGTDTITFGGQQFNIARVEPRRVTHFSMDVGGVLEFYPSRRVVTRFDFGDTIIRYGERNALNLVPGAPLIRVPAETEHNFQFTAGLGLRF